MEQRRIWRNPFGAVMGHTRLLATVVAVIVLLLVSIAFLTLSDLSPGQASVTRPQSPARDTSIETYYRPF